MRHNSNAAGGSASPNDAWHVCREALREEIPPPFFRTFIEPIRASALPCGSWKLQVEDAKLIPHIRSRYFTLIERGLGLPTEKIQFASLEARVGDTLETTARASNPPDFFSPARSRAEVDRLLAPRWPSSVAWVEGSSGCGKTALAKRLVFEADQNGSARYLTLEEYLSGFLRAMRSAKSIEWRDELREHSFLAIDDVQFLKKGAARTQEELRNLVDAFEASGARIVFFSDTPLELLEFSHDLSSRLRAGLRVRLHAPDEESRRKILISEAEKIGIDLPVPILHFLATELAGDGRKLRSAVLRLARFPGTLDVPAVREELADLIALRPVKSEAIVSAVARHFRVSVEDLTGPVRDARLSLVRQVAAYLCLDLGKSRTQDVAQLLGRKNHSHALYCRKKIEEKMAGDLFLATQIREIRADLSLSGDASFH